MKSSHRPPLNLSDPEPGEDHDAAAAVATDNGPASGDAFDADDLTLHPAPERPMSERRRRRLLEEQRLADERAAALHAQPAPDLGPLTVSADAPPIAVDETPPPAPVAARRSTVQASGGNAYLIAGLASALWIGGVASWFAYEFGSGRWSRCVWPSTP